MKKKYSKPILNTNKISLGVFGEYGSVNPNKNDVNIIDLWFRMD